MNQYIDTYVLLFDNNNMGITKETDIVHLPNVGFRIIYDQHYYMDRWPTLVGEIEARSLDDFGLYVVIKLYDNPYALNAFDPTFWQELFKKKLVEFTCSGACVPLVDGYTSVAALTAIHTCMIPCEPKGVNDA